MFARVGSRLLAELDQLIIDSCASPSDSLISLSYSMPDFSANLFGLFFLKFFKLFFFSVNIYERVRSICQILQSDWIINCDGFNPDHNFDHCLRLFAISHSGWTT